MEDVKTFNVYLLRHGKTVGDPALYGCTDVLVADETQRGIQRAVQAEQIAFSAVECSPLQRCQTLARLIVQENPQLSLVVAERWKETHFGALDGVPFESATEQWPKLEAFWQDPMTNTLPNAEPLADFYTRISNAWDEFIQALQQDTLIVCHGGTIRMILAKVLQLDIANPKIYSTLHIAHQSLTHIQITLADKHYERVCMIGKPLNG